MKKQEKIDYAALAKKFGGTTAPNYFETAKKYGGVSIPALPQKGNK